jgi:hypothetical protein
MLWGVLLLITAAWIICEIKNAIEVDENDREI